MIVPQGRGNGEGGRKKSLLIIVETISHDCNGRKDLGKYRKSLNKATHKPKSLKG